MQACTSEQQPHQPATPSALVAWLCRPPSTLKRLLSAIRLAQAEDPTGKQFVGMQRKPTGFVPATAPAALVSSRACCRNVQLPSSRPAGASCA